jgi:hypothetical protein
VGAVTSIRRGRRATFVHGRQQNQTNQARYAPAKPRINESFFILIDQLQQRTKRLTPLAAYTTSKCAAVVVNVATVRIVQESDGCGAAALICGVFPVSDA